MTSDESPEVLKMKADRREAAQAMAAAAVKDNKLQVAADKAQDKADASGTKKDQFAANAAQAKADKK